MHATHPKLARPILFACAWTLIVELVGLWLAGILGINYRLVGMSLVPGWLPIVAVAVRRPQKPTATDLVAMSAGYPVLFAVITVFDRWYF